MSCVIKRTKQIHLQSLITGLLCLVCWLPTGCTERNRANPIDPSNPVTGGKPQGVEVISKKDTVILSWDKLALDDLTRHVIYRSAQPGNRFEAIGETSSAQNYFENTGVEYDETYGYRLKALTKTSESLLSDPVYITPGPTSVWVLDDNDGLVIRFTHDTQHEIFRTLFSGFIERILVNPVDQTAWLFDHYYMRLYHISGEGKFLSYLDLESDALDLDIGWNDRTLWITQVENGDTNVVKLNSEGHVLVKTFGFSEIADLVVDQKRGNCWVADSGNGLLVHLDSDGRVMIRIPVEYPMRRIAIFDEDETIWIADNLSLKFLEFRTPRRPVTSVDGNFQSITALEIDQRTGACWVLDEVSVTKINPDGSKAFTVDGFYYPSALSVNAYSGCCLVADPYQNRAVMISEDGEQIENLPNLSYPLDVCVEYELPPTN